MNLLRLTFMFALCLSATGQTPSANTPKPPAQPSAAATKERRLVEIRHHYVLRHPADKTVHFEVTSIVRMTDDLDHNFLLIRDLEHGEVIFERIASFAEHQDTYTMSDVARRTFVRASFPTPWTGTTWREALEEAKQSPHLKKTPALVTVTTNGGEWRSVDTEERDWQRMRQMRYSIRPTVSFFLLEAAERMRGTVFATTDGGLYYEMVGRYLVYEPEEQSAAQLEKVAAPPACDFDSAFGFPCSERQLERIKKAAEAGVVMDDY